MKATLPAAALVMIVAACGSAERVREEPVSLDAAFAATAEAGTARTESVVVWKDADRTSTIRYTGLHDYRRGRSEISTAFAGRRSRTISIGDTSYSELDEHARVPGTQGKRWMRSKPLSEKHFEELNRDDCDDEGTSEKGEEGESVLGCSSIMLIVHGSPTESEDPGKMLDFLREYGSSVSTIGREEVRGAKTTHFRTLVDFRRASAAWYEEQGWSRENIERVLEGEPREPAEVNVWVGGDNLVRRIRTTRSYELPWDDRPSGVPKSWGSSTSVATTEYFDFGVEVDIREPPESEVIDFEDLPNLAE